ncbi:MAG: Hpt domain-containing protein [Magnetococcales bacterium]|nr:Hpt domain-containing protein [Magnetococcales bacterium]
MEPAIDLEEFSYLKEDMGSSLPSFLELFLQRLPTYLSSCHTYHKEKKWPELNREAHSLKGSSRYIGAMILGLYCQELEQLAGDEVVDEQQIAQTLIKLDAEARRVVQALEPLKD